MKHLANLDKLHGICILLKPNNARLTITFQYCIKELLANLHVDACRNIVFCFTNSRSTFYKPGDTLPALRALLVENRVNIETNGDTIYSIDNEAVRFLAAMKAGIGFEDEQRNNFSTSWRRSVDETERLMKRFAVIKPHLVKNTLSINDSRRMISALNRPIAEISSIIQENISAIKKTEVQLSKLAIAESIGSLPEEISTPTVTLKPVKLDQPLTVCMQDKCIDFSNSSNLTKPQYKCQLEITLMSTLRKRLSSKLGLSFTCYRCGCSLSDHKELTYDTEKLVTSTTDFKMAEVVGGRDEAIKLIKNRLEKLNCRDNELIMEQQQITEVGAKFACFLKSNAITPYNDALIEYLSYNIRNQKSRPGGGDPNTIERLEHMKEEYQKLCRMLNDTEDQLLLTPKDIRKLTEKLYDLKHMGQMLKAITAVAEEADNDAATRREVKVNIKRKQETPTTLNILQKLFMFLGFGS